VSFHLLRDYEKGHKNKQQTHGHNITSRLHCSIYDHDSPPNLKLTKISISFGS
jgi:hypothetical protein